MKKRKRHFTFRLDEDLHDELEIESERKDITPTMLMAKLTKNHLTRDKFFDELGFIPVSKDCLKIILEKLDEKNAELDGESISNTKIGEYVTYFYHKNDRDSLLNFLELYLSTQGGFRKENNNGTVSYTIHHNISKNYSLFLKGMLFGAIEKTLKTRVNLVEISPNLLSFNFEVG